ncbi:APC family permease [Leucobacter allii]|uniref:APC family permease n=1 Tax=Leucobacter allii TaxID=2932247 RepID=UPI001FD6217C|nr:APC family permease [Leucobacter allii]UOR01944.1 APC family permease [Leucobacter allii]
MTAAPPSDTSTSNRSISTFSLVMFILGAAAPLTILAGFAPIGLIAGGEGLVVGFLVPALVYLVFAIGFAAMSRHYEGLGAFYAYISRGISPTLGGAAGVVAYLGYLAGQIGFTASTGVFASALLAPILGVEIPWFICAVVISVGVGALSYGRVEIGARVLTALLLAEIGILVYFCVAVLLQGGYAGLSLHAFSPEVVFSTAVPAVFTMTFSAFIGFEQTAIYSQEVRDPRRTVSRATFIGITILGLGYTFCAWVILQAVGVERLPDLLAGDPSDLVFALNSEYAGVAMTAVMRALIVTSFIAGVIALQNAGSRYLLALGRSRILPAALGRTNPRSGTPSVAAVVQTGLVIFALIVFLIAGSDPYTEIIAWSSVPTIVAVLAMQILTSIAVIRYFREDPRGESTWSRLVAPILACILLFGGLFLLLSQLSSLTRLGLLGNCLTLSPLIIGAVYGLLRTRYLRGRDRGTPGLTTSAITYHEEQR